MRRPRSTPPYSSAASDVYKKQGEHKAKLAASVEDADATYWLEPEGLSWSLIDAVEGMNNQTVCHTVEALETQLLNDIQTGDDVVIMSNGSFSGLHRSLLAKLIEAQAELS